VRPRARKTPFTLLQRRLASEPDLVKKQLLRGPAQLEKKRCKVSRKYDIIAACKNGQ
jgi:hypothetical protein